MKPGLHATVACLWEATARKPGNVYPGRAGYTDFLQSAAAIGPIFDRAPERRVGETVLDAIRATRAVVSTNTNLGIVLLLSPLAKSPKNIADALNELTIADSRDVFQAIRLAEPGGMARASEQDLADEPTMPLRDIMALAADRDLIARQYANGFQEVLEDGTPRLRQLLAETHSTEEAIIGLHLHLLGRYPDSLIARKHGLAVAQEASERARAVDRRDPAQLADLDRWLRDGRNPGTTADLVTACLFTALRTGIMTLPTKLPWACE